jgi:hypothetical protein
VTAKPTVADLGIDPGAQRWQRSGDGTGAIEIAFVQVRDPVTPPAPATSPATPPAPRITATSALPANADAWVLMRVSDDPDGRVLVFDRHEWECFLDGARKGEFDDAAGSAAN